MSIKAEITPVSIGHLTIEGLMNENGEFGVAVPQLASINLVPQNRSVKQLNALLGEAFPSHEIKKWKTTLNSKEVNVLPLEHFQNLVRVLDKSGNHAASAFVDALLGLSLHQLFCDAFGIKFEKEDRHKWLMNRMQTKHDFRPLTDQLKLSGFTQPQEYARFVWAFQSKLGIESGGRDNLTTEELIKLHGKQIKLTTLMECGFSPWQALGKI